ncbi:MAG: hypothetical protein V8T00_01545 [Oscillospiraceae bacterium]
MTKGHKLMGLVWSRTFIMSEDDNATIETIMTDHVVAVNTAR